MKTKIYEHDSLYSFLRPYVDWCCKRSYRKAEVSGLENIPEDGAVIIAPNHCNTLMDALVVLRAFKGPTVFGARADMFNNKTVARIMFFLRIVPMVRQRDGLRNVLKNHETIEIIVETVKSGVRFCMYPEGRHRPARSIMHLGKGIFRAALAADQELGGSKPVYIVPAGIEYGDYFRYRSTSLLTFGEPVNVTGFIKDSGLEHEGQIIDSLRNELYGKMSELITFFPDDENLDASWILMKMLAAKEKRSGSLHDRMEANRKTAQRITAKLGSSDAAELLDKVRDFDRKRRSRKISIHAFGSKNPLSKAIISCLAALVLAPWTVFCLAAAFPMIAAYLALKRKVRDRAFHNTVGFGVKLALGPITFILWAVLGFCLLPWFIALPVLLLTIPAYGSFFDCIDFYRRTISSVRLAGDRKMRETYQSITEEFETL